MKNDQVPEFYKIQELIDWIIRCLILSFKHNPPFFLEKRSFIDLIFDIGYTANMREMFVEMGEGIYV